MTGVGIRDFLEGEKASETAVRDATLTHSSAIRWPVLRWLSAGRTLFDLNQYGSGASERFPILEPSAIADDPLF
jgi:hypothetical protein